MIPYRINIAGIIYNEIFIGGVETILSSTMNVMFDKRPTNDIT